MYKTVRNNLPNSPGFENEESVINQFPLESSKISPELKRGNSGYRVDLG